MTYTFSNRSQNCLSTVHPALCAVAELALTISPIDFTVTDCARDIDTQRRLVSEGKSKTMNSKHLPQADGYVHAFDAYPYYSGSVQVNAPMDKFKLVADAMQQAADILGVKITRGYDWGWDAPHYELVSAVGFTPLSPGAAQSPAPTPAPAPSAPGVSPVYHAGMARFDIAYAPMRGVEGGWCDVPGDRGGETYAGITKVYATQWPGWAIVDAEKSHPSFSQGAAAFSRHLDALPGLQRMVEDWYRTEWWDKMGIAQYPQYVANELFEQAVNMGRGGSGKLIQEICNAYNYRNGGGQWFPDLKIDGAVGPATLEAITIILRERVSPEELTHALNAAQMMHYVRLAAGDPTQRKFMCGWDNRTYDEFAVYPDKKGGM